MTTTSKTELRFVMALYYAYGRKDAGSNVDPLSFAEYYKALFADVENGVTAYCPSVQDAFNHYVAPTPMVGGDLALIVNNEPTMVGIADEVRDFLAKAIDDSMADLDAIDNGGDTELHERFTEAWWENYGEAPDFENADVAAAWAAWQQDDSIDKAAG